MLTSSRPLRTILLLSVLLTAVLSVGGAPVRAAALAVLPSPDDQQLRLRDGDRGRADQNPRSDAALRAAREEVDAGRTDSARLMLHALLDDEPDFAAALDLLELIASAVPLPHTSATLVTTEQSLPSRMQPYESGHFVVFSDIDRQSIRRHAIRLERTRHQFRRFSIRLGLRERPLRHRLVAVLFADRDDYRDFAATHDGVRDTWIAGYYAPSTDRIVFYDIRSNPSIVEAERRIESLRQQIERMVQQRTDEPYITAVRSHIEREEERVALFAESTSTATTVHEAAHQLAFHTRIQVPWVQYPIWLSEGLATSFETDDVDLPFGPDRDYEPRRRRFHELREAGDLIPLRELVGMIDAGPHASDDLVDQIYHQSYALFTWLYRSRRGELARFMRAMRLEPAGAVSSERAIALFETCFGPIERVERAWLRVMQSDAAQ